MMNKVGSRARLYVQYQDVVRKQLKDTLKLANIMEVPRLEKVVLNIGVKKSVGDSKTLQLVEKTLAAIAGQSTVRTNARKSIATFKIREGMPVGICVTLRRENMYIFLDKLITLSLPKVRDFQGLSPVFDGRGGYNIGIKEWGIFPEADDISIDHSFGLNISIHTSTHHDEHAYELLKSLGMPFRKR